ncbi:MAG: elongation factor P hydroxylase [Sinobacterium sp.]
MKMHTALPVEQTLCSLPSAEATLHNYQDLIVLFNATFMETEKTILVKGDHEPVYIPAKRSQYHQIVFAHGYFASALHEIAHWCIAGKQRRLLEDYGYWYNPDGRDNKQQIEFEKVEVKPQAIEWAFSCMSGKHFTVSTDNLEGAAANTQIFQNTVKRQVNLYLELGFPPRAAEFMGVLQKFYQTNNLHQEMFDVESA